MLKRLIVPLSAILLISGGTSPASVEAQGLGISGGANFAELDDIDSGDRQATFDNATGWHLHLWFDLPLGPVALRPGIRYMDMGELFQDSSLPTQFDDETASLVEVPVDVRLRLGLPLVAPYVMAGPVLRFPSGSGDDRFESFSLAGGAGVGLELGLGGLTLYPELKYTFGITRFTQESYEVGGVTFSPDDDQHLNAVMLSVGIGL